MLEKVMKYMYKPVSKVYAKVLHFLFNFFFFYKCIVLVIFKKEGQIGDTLEDISRDYDRWLKQFY
jgi:hypothetical protein